MFEDSLITIFTGSLMLSLLPILLLGGTCFVKIQIVLNIFKNSLGLQGIPSSLVTFILALSLSFLVMEPVVSSSFAVLDAEQVANFKDLSSQQKLELATKTLLPWGDFINQHTSESSLRFVNNLIKKNKNHKKSENRLSQSSRELLAFLITEIKEAMEIGLLIIIPFILVDFLIANLLTGIGLQLMSPVLVSLPLKILLVIVLDIWELLFQALYFSYGL